MKTAFWFAMAASLASAQQAGALPAAVEDARRAAAPIELTDEIEIVGRRAESCAVLALGDDGVEYHTVEGVRRAGWDVVARLRTGRTVALTLANGDRTTATLVGVEERRLRLETSSFGAVSVGLNSLAPLPEAPSTQDAAAPKTPLTPTPWKGSVSLNGSFRAGNSDQILVALRAATEKNWEYDKLSFAIEALYGKSDGNETNRSLFGKARFDHFWSDRFYGYASLDALYDKIQAIDLRAVASVGVGYQVWKANEDRLFAVEGGLSGIYTKYANGDDPLSPAARAAATFKEILFKDVKFTQEAELLLPIDDVGAFLVRSRTAFAVPVDEGWSMKTSLDVNYNADPAVGRRPFDILFLIGLEYGF